MANTIERPRVSAVTVTSTMQTLNPPERLLMGPGPSNPDPRVLAALSKRLVGHLDPYFVALMDETMIGLRQVFRTKNHHTLPISGTGSAGLETIMLNLLEPGDGAIVCVVGHFGQRLAELARRSGADVRTVEAGPGEIVDPSAVDKLLSERPAKLVAFVHVETTTGARQPIVRMVEVAKRHGALVAMDCVTSLGGMPVLVDENGIDIAYSCTQKGLSAPPGLSPFTVSPRAMERLNGRTFPNPVWYLDLKLLLDYYDGKKYHHTAPVSTFYALREALAAIQEEGVEQRFGRHLQAHQSFVRRIESIGLKMHVREGQRLTTLNTPRVPGGVDEAKVRGQLLEAYGIEIAGGFGPLAGKIFRIGLMGTSSSQELVDLLTGALEQALNEASVRKA